MMNMSAIETLALILITLTIIKIVIILYNPKLWFNFIEKIFSVPPLVSALGFITSLVVLYLLINSGITIIEILAVALFIVLLMLTGLANYVDEIMGWVRGQDFVFMMKRLWLYSLAWVMLIAWGIKELLLL